MNQLNNWSGRVDDLVQHGQFADALEFLEREYRTPREGSTDQSIDKLAKLIDICYTQLNHNKANRYAVELQKRLKIKSFNWPLSLLLSYIVSFNYLLFGSSSTFILLFIRRRLFGKIHPQAKWKHLHSILFAKFWHNIRECTKYPLLQLTLPRSPEEHLFSMGLLGYSLSYSGHNFIGNRVLQKAVDQAKQHNFDSVVNQLYPHLAIGYGMAANPDKAFTVYDEMASSLELSPFYELVIAANKISLSLADKNLMVTQQAIEKCFNQSFSLANTANHVQIYGGQAVLFAMLFKADEAISLMKKSLASADICSSPLNYLFYYRLEALMWYLLGDFSKCDLSLKTAFDYCRQYGFPKWHILELKRIDTANRAENSQFYLMKKLYSFRFLIDSLLIANFGLSYKGLSLVGKNFLNRNFSYWSDAEKVEFLGYYLKEADQSTGSHLGKMSLTIASAFIESCKTFSVSKGLDSEGLTKQIRQSLPVTDVVCFSSQPEVMEYVYKRCGEKNIAVINEKTDKVRVKCADHGFFICVASPKITHEHQNETQTLYVGILISEVDIQSEELIEAFLRVMLSQYAFSRSILMLEEQKRLKVEREAAINQAIAKTVQMLAHDVRRPFSMVQGILDVLASTDDATDAQAFAVKHLPEIKRAIANVTNMLNDVIEVGTLGKLELQSISPKSLVESVLVEHFRYNETANIVIRYGFEHSLNVNVDVTKISRVLTNIVINALQAMSFSGELWFKTEERMDQGRKVLHFTAGNSGSYITDEEIEKLFEPYYTKGKKSGTGLGLAIADKVIREHGGQIWCVSYENKGTEFQFTLPCASEADSFVGIAFEHSNKIYRHFQPAKEKESDFRYTIDHDEETKFEQLAINALKNVGKDLSILITDDEPFYRSILKEQLLFDTEISKRVDISLSSSGEQALRLCEEHHFDIIVMDVDFGPTLANGFETVRELRNQGNTAKMIIHSNRGALQYQSMSIEAGADLFIPKPMSRAIFLKIIASVLQDIQGNDNSSISA